MPLLFPLRQVGGNSALRLLRERVSPPVILRVFGVTKTQQGAPIPSCTVKLFRTSDDEKIAETTSDSQGYYQFTHLPSGVNYYVVAYNNSGPVFGTTVNTLAGN